MILSDRGIYERLLHPDQEKRLIIHPMVDWEKQIQPASVDVRLGNQFIVYNRDPSTGGLLTEKSWVEDGQMFMIEPGEFILATTKERIGIPADLQGRVDGKSSLGRLGLLIHVTAGNLDPGFGKSGEPCEVTLEITSVFPVPVPLMPGMMIAHLVFTQLDQPAAHPYGGSRGSHYHQQLGPQPSRFLKDGYFKYDKVLR
jgi:dCTP deaminase